MSTPVVISESDLLVNNEKLIRDAILDILKKQKLLKDVKAYYTNLIPDDARPKPYIYCFFVGRRPNTNANDIYQFNYIYDFRVGVVVELNTKDDKELEDKALDLINTVESAITANPRILDKVDLYFYEKQMQNQDLSFLPNHRHYFLQIPYTAYVESGS